MSDEGYTEPTPIQAQAIPVVLSGKDVMAGAQTGTGKTAAFVLPLLHRMAPLANTSTSPARHPVRALIITPTRELAAQVQESVVTYGKHLPLRSAVVYGGVSIDPQIKELAAGVEILVATPGRLLDHLQSRTVNLSRVEFLVLDEADRMLDMGFIHDIKRIVNSLPKERQSLLFSATFSEDIRRLADSFLKSPDLIEVARRNTAAESVAQVAHPVARGRKRELLSYIIRTQELQQVLVFCGTRHGANRLAYQLEKDGISTTAIHSDKSQPQRMQALADFKAGAVRVLVATDIAARGLDIEELPNVVNFDVPHSPEDYVHRIGRTGRAGLSGSAITLVCEEEREKLLAIERLIKRDVPIEVVTGFQPDPGMVSALLPRGRAGAERGGLTGETRERRPERAPRRDRDEHRSERPERPRRSGPPRERVDSAFSQPFPDAAADPRPDLPQQEAAASYGPRRPAREIPALLGGLNVKKNPA